MRTLFILGLAFLCGCNTFRTTAIDRTEDDCLVVNPDCPMKGIPVSIRVPTHLEINVIETTYWEKKDIVGSKPTLVPIHTCRPTRTVQSNICYTEKVFLVDPVRPASGMQSYGFTFQSKDGKNSRDQGKGYLQNVAYKIDDQTIKESTNLLANSLGLLQGFAVSANQPQPNEGSLVATDRSIAFTRIDINSPYFETEVEQFLDTHVNNRCGEVPCPQICQPEMCKVSTSAPRTDSVQSDQN